jgi:hypothetical protein
MSSGGQAIGGVVGAVAGFFLGGPTGALYGAQIGMLAGGYLDPPKGPTLEGPRLSDLSVQSSTYGAVIPRVYGTVTVNGNVFWLENNTIKETVTKKKSGGKGGGSKSTTRNYNYSATFAVGLCKGPIAGVKRIWIGADLYYDAGSSDPGTIQASNDAAAGFDVYNGTDTQAADARMQATLGVANTPAWRGLAYIVFSDLPLTKYGNSLAGAQVRVEVMTLGATYDYVATQRSMPTSRTWTHVAWGNGTFCALAEHTAVCSTSPDGITWTDRSLPASLFWQDIAFGNGLFIAVSSGPSCYTSPDGITWTTQSMVNNVWHNGVEWNGSMFLCVTDSAAFEVSANGSSWTAEAAPAGGLFKGPWWNGSLWIVIEQFGAKRFWTSPTGTAGSWTVRNTPTGGNWNSGAVKNGVTCIGSASSSGIYTSPDGITWTHNTGLAANIFDIETDGVVFLATYSGTNFSTSLDGITWTTRSMPTNSTWAGLAWNGSVFAGMMSGQNPVTIPRTFVSSLVPTLDNVVSAEFLQSGLLSAGDIDVTALTQSVRGYRVGSVGAIRSALEPLQAAWPFDVRQHGYKIQCVARGGSSVVTIPAADLDARTGGNAPGVQITTSREMDSQIARRVTVQHLDYDREFNAGTQYAERLNTSSINAITLDLPIVLTATEAAGKAEVLLYVYWLERYDVSINLPPTYNQLEPADVVTLVTPEGNVSLRLTAVTNTSDARVECQAKYADAAIYTPTAVGASPAVTGPVTITPVGASVYVLMDLPEISTSQNTPCFLAAMTGAVAGWAGGALMQSTDSGSTWADLHDFGAPGCTMGAASTTMGSVDTGIMDNASELTVTLTQGTLSSVTQLALFGGANHFAYGINGRWEIIAAMTCTLVSGSTYTLSNFLRGRFGTEQYMASHAAGDSVVLLDTTDLALIVMGAGTIGLSYLYRGITFDRDISTDSNRTFAYSAINLKPLAPIYLTGNRDSSNDWALTWIRRTRDGGEWRDNVDAALGEASEAYQIDVFADGTYAVVKRTLTTVSPSSAYTSADQTTDFGSNQGTLYLKLYQISATVGRGYPLTASITR